MALQLISFPKKPGILDVPDALRQLAQAIEAGEYGDAHNLAWVIDRGTDIPAIGLMGKAAAPGAEAHLLFGIAQHLLVKGCI